MESSVLCMQQTTTGGSPNSCTDRIRMQDEEQSPALRVTSLSGQYSFTSTAESSAGTERRASASEDRPSKLLLYRSKRIVDILLILLSFPVTLPILGVLSLIVLLSTPGPIFYSHRRIGRNGAFFSMWKFRTMCENSAEVLEEYLARHPQARAEWSRTHKLRYDPRVTRIGRFLRRYSLDELPQLWNVLAGKMTLVGPRPIVAAEVEKYGDGFRFYRRVKPGLTGLWQVSGRSQLTYPERVQMDCDYVERWSMQRDFVILLRTFLSVVNQDGAY